MAKNKAKTTPIPKTPPLVQTSPPSAVPAWTMPEWAIAGILLLLVVLLRWQYIDIPLERDESVYTYLGKAALQGGKPYHDFYEMKPPGLFYSYALLVGLFGYSGAGPHLALLFVALSNTLFTYLIARHLSGRQVAVVAAVAYIFLSLNPGASGMYLASEHVALLWGLPGLWLALQYPKRSQPFMLVLSGVLLALAVLVKQTAAAFGVAVVVYWLMQWRSLRTEFVWKPLLWWVAGGVLPVLGAFLIVWASGTMQEAQFWLSDYPQHYATSTNDNRAGLYFQTSWFLVSKSYEGYFWVMLGGLLVLWRSGLTTAYKIFLATWLALSALTIVPGMRFYGHYYIMAFPAGCIAGALLFDVASRWLQKRNEMSLLLLSLGLLWGAHHVFVRSDLYFRPSLQAISRVYSPGNPFVEHEILSRELKKVVQPNDTVMVFGSDPQYYIYLNKMSPSRHMYMPFLSKAQFPEAFQWQQEIVNELKKLRPKYVIFNGYPYAWMTKYDYSNPFTKAILEVLHSPEYEPFEFIETDSKSKPAVVKYKVQQGAIRNNVYFVQVFRRKEW
ncbi:MAG: glycosyltransferase family 39 protein [Bacteroidetes bacterium]|nr:glycosyltransferase family 39 protein [Bacteroidota bacterium]